MPALRGPLRGPARGPVRAHQATGGGGAVTSIYDVTSAEDANAVLQALAGTADDLTPAALWTCDEAAGNLVDVIGGVELAPQNSAGTIVSPHGRAARQVAASDEAWFTADTGALNFGLGAFAFAVRARHRTTTGGVWLGKGSPAGAHYQSRVLVDGSPVLWAKQSGGVLQANVAANVLDDTWRWWLFGRSVTAQKLWLWVPEGYAEAAFADTIDLSTTINGFGLWSMSAFDAASVDCDTDHLIAFDASAAENVYTNAAALGAALEAAE